MSLRSFHDDDVVVLMTIPITIEQVYKNFVDGPPWRRCIDLVLAEKLQGMRC